MFYVEKSLVIQIPNQASSGYQGRVGSIPTTTSDNSV